MAEPGEEKTKACKLYGNGDEGTNGRFFFFRYLLFTRPLIVTARNTSHLVYADCSVLLHMPGQPAQQAFLKILDALEMERAKNGVCDGREGEKETHSFFCQPKIYKNAGRAVPRTYCLRGHSAHLTVLPYTDRVSKGQSIFTLETTTFKLFSS